MYDCLADTATTNAMGIPVNFPMAAIAGEDFSMFPMLTLTLVAVTINLSPQSGQSSTKPGQSSPKLGQSSTTTTTTSTATLASTTVISTCSKCGIVKKSGKHSCCARGGAWFKKCGDVGDTKFNYTWHEGMQACESEWSGDLFVRCVDAACRAALLCCRSHDVLTVYPQEQVRSGDR